MNWTCHLLRFDGDYGILTRTDDPSGAEIMVARMLLPEDAYEGCILVCENFVYRMEE